MWSGAGTRRQAAEDSLTRAAEKAQGRLARSSVTGVSAQAASVHQLGAMSHISFVLRPLADLPFLLPASGCIAAVSRAHLRAEIGPESFPVWPEGRDSVLCPFSVSTLWVLSQCSKNRAGPQQRSCRKPENALPCVSAMVPSQAVKIQSTEKGAFTHTKRRRVSPAE